MVIEKRPGRKHQTALLTYLLPASIKLAAGLGSASSALCMFALYSFVMGLVILIWPRPEKKGLHCFNGQMVAALAMLLFAVGIILNVFFMGVLGEAQKEPPAGMALILLLLLLLVYTVSYYRFSKFHLSSSNDYMLYSCFRREIILCACVAAGIIHGIFGYAYFDLLVALGISLHLKQISLAVCMEALSLSAARKVAD